MAAAPAPARYVRFHPTSNPTSILIGQPVDANIDVGTATRQGKGASISVQVYSGTSVLAPGDLTPRHETIARLLSPLAMEEVGTIRCIGLNYRQHAAEVKLDLPTEPTVFLKPGTALADPWPAPTVIPKFTVGDDCCDYESELAIVIGRRCKDVRAEEAWDYVLGYTAANDVSSRKSQFSQSQWCFSKGFDGACPLGPVLVAHAPASHPDKLRVRGLKNGEVMQDCGTNDLCFGVAELVAFVSQGTTLLPGTVILTGTPAGVGVSREPKGYLRDGDEFSVEILPWIGTLTTKFEAER